MSLCKLQEGYYNQSSFSWCCYKKGRKKIVYFVICFHLIYKSKPVMNYENMKKLLYFLDVKDFSKLYQINTIRWGMATCMCELMMNKTKALVQVATFISFSYDEITTMDHQSWFSIHTYVVENWQIIIFCYPYNRLLMGPFQMI